MDSPSSDTDDTLRAFEQMATASAIAPGRAEIVAGRGSTDLDVRNYDGPFVHLLGDLHLTGAQSTDVVLPAVGAQLSTPAIPAAPATPTLEAAPTAGGGGALMAQLVKLGEMKTAGLLTDEKFTAAKAKLLAQRPGHRVRHTKCGGAP
ncbi:SHOCT domain-containing protein [Actinoplanes sp. NPDC049802]|uniref:SHOCT domain-containing protein n=1 Tax=Actinoplanes sp. NPDC049802 TaxID=3154742 RepID=UPI00340AD1FE